MGRCYSIEIDEETAKLSVVALSITSQPGLRLYIYVHVPGQFHEMDSLAKVITTLGYKNYVDMTYSVIQDTLGAESKTPCTEDVNYSFDQCLHAKAEYKLMSMFGCSVPFFHHNNSIPICSGHNKER